MIAFIDEHRPAYGVVLRQARDEADLQSAADRPVDVPRPCRATQPSCSRGTASTSRSAARCLAVLVASPGEGLDLVAKRVDEMRLANPFCYAAEHRLPSASMPDAVTMDGAKLGTIVRGGAEFAVDFEQPDVQACPNGKT